MLAIIGGSGFEKFDAFETVERLSTETPFGAASSGLKRVRIGEHEALFVSRHGEHHESLPSEVNYRANVFALKKAGASAIVSFSAVGSLRRELEPGHLVIPSQYIDRTKGVRAHTFLGEGLVGHVSLAQPICSVMSQKAQTVLQKAEFIAHLNKTYVCIEGPYFSTKAESDNYRQMNADIIGMTNFPEFALAREAGIPYLPCCFVTDFDCWDDSRPHVTLQEVLEVMRTNNAKAFWLTQGLLAQGKSLWAGSTTPEEGLRMGMMTPQESWPKSAQEWLSVVLG